MLFNRLKVSGFLSFGAEGIDLELRPLNVLIGANGSGKSNLIEAFGVIKGAARSDLTERLNREELAKEWLHKGKGEARLEAWVNPLSPGPVLQHELVLREQNGRLELGGERVLDGGEGPVYDFREGNPLLRIGRGIRADRVRRDQSILTLLVDPENYPEFSRLEESYRWMQMHRNFDFGHSSRMRDAQSRDIRSDHLMDGGLNLAAVLSQFPGEARREVVRCLQHVYEGIVDFRVSTGGSDTRLFVEEKGGLEVPIRRLSDGTLRYLYLLAILLHPDPPPFVVIEEPELGLHPDLIHVITKLIREASKRMQIVITTHSRQLIDALSEEPEAVVVCEEEDGESRFERLDGERMKVWLERYSLGELWGKGELGGNRWLAPRFTLRAAARGVHFMRRSVVLGLIFSRRPVLQIDLESYGEGAEALLGVIFWRLKGTKLTLTWYFCLSIARKYRRRGKRFGRTWPKEKPIDGRLHGNLVPRGSRSS